MLHRDWYSHRTLWRHTSSSWNLRLNFLSQFAPQLVSPTTLSHPQPLHCSLSLLLSSLWFMLNLNLALTSVFWPFCLFIGFWIYLPYHLVNVVTPFWVTKSLKCICSASVLHIWVLSPACTNYDIFHESVQALKWDCLSQHAREAVTADSLSVYYNAHYTPLTPRFLLRSVSHLLTPKGGLKGN